METVRAILAEMQQNPGSTVCKAMEGLIEEGEEVASEEGNPDAKDVALIAAAQKIEHYEIASYGSLRTFAKMLGYDRVAGILQEILDEEYDADQLLDNLAMGVHNKTGLNREAMHS